MAVTQIDGGSVDFGNETLPVEIRVNPRARRLILRLSRTRTIRVTCPSKHHVSEAMAMIASRRAWIEERLQETPTSIPFTPGQVFPVLGIDREIIRSENVRSAARLDDDCIISGGRTELAMARRIETCLREVATVSCRNYAQTFADRLGVTIGQVSVRQMTTRWGSCASSGNLSFNWRLIFAPVSVLRYVVAHEVAHRRHMDHSASFWRTTETLDPDYKKAEHWLRHKGYALHAFGNNHPAKD